MRRTAVGLLVLAVALAGCIGSAPRPDEADDGYRIEEPVAPTLLINRTVGPPTHEHLRTADSLLPVRDGDRIRLLSSGFGSELLELVSAQGFPNPLTFPLDPATHNPVVDGRVRPVLAPPSPDASTWTAQWGNRTLSMTVAEDGVRGETDTGATWVAAYEDVPWQPRMLRFVNATGTLALNVSTWGAATIEDGDVFHVADLSPMAEFQGQVDTVSRTASETATIETSDGGSTYLWMNLECGPERSRMPAAGRVAFKIAQDGARANEACDAPATSRSCLANAAVRFDSGDVRFKLRHDVGAFSEMRVRAAIYGLQMDPFEVQGDRAVPVAADDDPRGTKMLDCVFEQTGDRSLGIDLV